MRFPLLGGSLLAMAGMAQALLGFGANLILVRHLSPADFGSYALALAVVSVTFSVVSLRLAPLIIRDQDLDHDASRGSMYSGAMLVETAVATIMAIGAVLILGEMTDLAMVLIIAVSGTHMLGAVRAFFERRMKLSQSAAVETVSSVLSHGAAVLMVFAGFGVSALYLRDVVALLASAFGLWLIGALKLPMPRRLSSDEWKAVLRQGSGLWLDGVLEGLLQRLTIMAAAWFGGTRDAGFFFQAQRLALVPHQILLPLVVRTAMVWLSRLPDATSRRRGRDRLLVFAGTALLAATLLTVMFADPVVPWLFGETWRPVSPLLIWLSGVIMFCTLFEIVKVFCLADAQTSVLLLGRVAQYAAWTAVLMPWMLSGGGSVMVLAAATSACYLFAFVIMMHLLKRAERRSHVSAL